MSFSKYRILFLSLSVIAFIALFGVTYGVHGGFARSVTFNGGIRLSLLLPPGMGQTELTEAAKRAGLDDPQVRQTDVLSNKYDLELGPDVREKIRAEIEQASAERRAKIQAWQDSGKSLNELPDELRREPTVGERIKDRLLPELGIQEDRVVSQEALAASYGSDLFGLAMRTLVYTIIVIGLYLTFRFDFPFAVGASLALVHDLLMTLAFIGAFQIEPSIPVLAAVLTVLGYSINDTIVIFDRIRENVSDRQQATIGATVDLAITQTLSRTTITSLLTLLSLLAIVFGGADSLYDFAYVIIFGIAVGTYSSIFIASHFVQFYEEFRSRLRAR